MRIDWKNWLATPMVSLEFSSGRETLSVPKKLSDAYRDEWENIEWGGGARYDDMPSLIALQEWIGNKLDIEPNKIGFKTPSGGNPAICLR